MEKSNATHHIGKYSNEKKFRLKGSMDKHNRFGIRFQDVSGGVGSFQAIHPAQSTDGQFFELIRMVFAVSFVWNMLISYNIHVPYSIYWYSRIHL